MDSADTESQHWSLDRRVTVGNLVTTLAVIVSVVVWSQKLEHRVAMVESTVEDMNVRINTVTERTDIQYTELLRRIDRLHADQQRQYENLRDLLDAKEDRG